MQELTKRPPPTSFPERNVHSSKIEVKLLVTLLQMLQTPIESFCSTVFFISIPSNAGINEAPSSNVISGKECSFLETLL